MGRCGLPPGRDPGYPESPSVADQYLPAWDPTLAPFDAIGEVSVAPGTIWTRVVGFQCGLGRRGYHERFGLDVDNLLAWQGLKVRIARGGSTTVGAVQYENLESLVGWLWRDMRPFPFHFNGAEWIELQVMNSGADTYTVRGCLKGVTTAAGAEMVQ